jgi:hypothetical protein
LPCRRPWSAATPACPRDVASDLTRQASDKARDLAGWLESREPGDLLEEVRDLARRKPGTFLLGAAAAGVLAGRLTRSAIDVKRDDSSGTAAENANGNGNGQYAGGPSYPTATPYSSSATVSGRPAEGGDRL